MTDTMRTAEPTWVDPGKSVTHTLAAGRHAWLQVAAGAVELNGKRLGEGDGAAVTGEQGLTISAISQAEILLFDLS